MPQSKTQWCEFYFRSHGCRHGGSCRGMLPLIELLRGTTKRGIQDVMIDVMPMITAPNMRKEDLIAMLADYVRNSGMPLWPATAH